MSPVIEIQGRMAQAGGSWHRRGDHVEVTAAEAERLVDLGAAELVKGGGTGESDEVTLPDPLPTDLGELKVPQLLKLAADRGIEIPSSVKAKPAILELVKGGGTGE